MCMSFGCRGTCSKDSIKAWFKSNWCNEAIGGKLVRNWIGLDCLRNQATHNRQGGLMEELSSNWFVEKIDPSQALHGYSRQSQDFVIIFCCSRSLISSFWEKMLIEPDSNATRENDLHMRYDHLSIHSSIHPWLHESNYVRAIHDSNRYSNWSKGMNHSSGSDREFMQFRTVSKSCNQKVGQNRQWKSERHDWTGWSQVTTKDVRWRGVRYGDVKLKHISTDSVSDWSRWSVKFLKLRWIKQSKIM
jgi:hypothetical protein